MNEQCFHDFDPSFCFIAFLYPSFSMLLDHMIHFLIHTQIITFQMDKQSITKHEMKVRSMTTGVISPSRLAQVLKVDTQPADI